MELWIRSQDKKDLIKATSVCISKADYDKIEIFVNGCLVGFYKSTQRALEVLDEIQKALEPKMILHTEEIKKPITEYMYTTEEIKDIKELSNYVYEMPSK